jgi:16S rRNA (uracil1498-N3)-methyltransferase
MAKHTLRLHTNQPLDVGQAICLEAHHHRLKRVMRAAIGDNVRLFNGAEDADYWAKITHLDQHQARAHIESREAMTTESDLRLTLCLCVIKQDKMDWAIQKAVELGAHTIVPVHSEFSQRIAKGAADRQHQRWQKIITSAAEQCLRVRLPHLAEITHFSDLLRQTTTDDLLLYAHPHNGPTKLAGLPSPHTVRVLIGPEGGLSATECAQLQQHQATPLSLGPRILRAETACCTALTLCQALLGDLRSA